MKIYFLFFILVTKIHAQSIDVLNNSDTIYLELHNCKNKLLNFSIQYNNNTDIYIYNLKSKSNYEVRITTFLKNDFYQRNFKIGNLNKFKKINRNKILTLEDIDKNGLFETFSKLIKDKKKKIFIIDESIRKNKKIIKNAQVVDNHKILM